MTKHTLTGTVADALGLPGENEMYLLDELLRPLTANGFEFRGGDTFGQEIVGLYFNERLDEFVMLRYNRPQDEQGRPQPPLIHRGAMAELDQPMDCMDSLRFMTVHEFLGRTAPREEAGPQPQLPPSPRAAFRPFGAGL